MTLTSTFVVLAFIFLGVASAVPVPDNEARVSGMWSAQYSYQQVQSTHLCKDLVPPYYPPGKDIFLTTSDDEITERRTLKREDDFGATNDGIEYKPVEPEDLEDESN